MLLCCRQSTTEPILAAHPPTSSFRVCVSAGVRVCVCVSVCVRFPYLTPSCISTAVCGTPLTTTSTTTRDTVRSAPATTTAERISSDGYDVRP